MSLLSILAATVVTACTPRASIAGEPELRTAIARELEAGGLVAVGDRLDDGCFALRVRVEKHEARVVLTAADAWGATLEQTTSSARMAATVIEAWAIGAAESSETHELAENGPHGRWMGIYSSGHGSVTTDGQTWIGGAAGAALFWSQFAFGAELLIQGRESSYLNQLRSFLDVAALGTASYRLRVDRLMLGPELGLGMGYARAGDFGFQGEAATASGFRSRAGFRVSYFPDTHWAADILLFAMLQPDPLKVTAESDLQEFIGLSNGTVSFGLGFGVWFVP